MTPRELAQSYALIEEKVSASLPAGSSIAAETFSEDHEIQRFFRRLGMLPRGRPGAPASETVLTVIDAVSREAGRDPERARSVLAAYCKGNGRCAAAVCGKTPQCTQCPLTGHCAFFSKKPTIKQMPEAERPRERLLQLGQQQLTDAELLAIILGGGTTEQTAVELARGLLTRFGGLRALADCSPAELRKVRGIGAAKSAAIKAALEIARRFGTQPTPTKAGAFLNPEAVFERYRTTLGTEKRETFLALLLDAKNRLIRDVTISLGSLTQSIVHPREVFEPAIRDSAASVLFVHNHPSGDTTPSSEDIEITRRLRQTGEVIGIRVLDHVIVSESSYTSLTQKGLL